MHDSRPFWRITICLKLPKEGPLEEALRTLVNELPECFAEFQLSHFKELQKSSMLLHRL